MRPDAPPFGFIGASEPMREVYARIIAAARSMATVFISGECGTGKDLCALAVHALSPRHDGPFVALNCGAISPEMLESEVFGHSKDAFPGATSDKPGAALSADGGTLFLDDICALSSGLQAKLLTFLRNAAVQPSGAQSPHRVNVRILCATSRDSLAAVHSGQFREDLYYRLFVVPIRMPPLRGRGADIEAIAAAALARFAQEEGRVFSGFAPGVAAMLARGLWPGNVRQLLNMLRGIVVMNSGPLVTADMLPPDLRTFGGVDPGGTAPDVAFFRSRSLAEIERVAIEAALTRHAGSVPRAAHELKVSPSTLYRKIDAWARAGA